MLHFQAVTKYYGNRLVFDHASFQIPAGTFSCLSGPTGSGKSTLMQLILNQILPDGGDILFYNQRLGRLSGKPLAAYRQRIGWIDQSLRFFKDLNVKENIVLQAGRAGITSKKIQRQLEEVSEMLGLYPYMKVPIATLSLGEQQLVQIARVLVHQPSLILAEDPLQFLEPSFANTLQHVLSEMSTQLETTIIVTANDARLWNDPHLHHYKIESHQILEV
ncbi:ATP-binding cassette domain-containing protein [Deltaproteobacteria bacterium TL4]